MYIYYDMFNANSELSDETVQDELYPGEVVDG